MGEWVPVRPKYKLKDGVWQHPNRPSIGTPPEVGTAGLQLIKFRSRATGADPVIPDNDWSDVNLPWAYTDTSVFTEDWPSDVIIRSLSSFSSDTYTAINETINAVPSPGRVVVDMPDGVHSYNSFRLIGSSGDPTYSFGFFNPRLRGFLANGPDKCAIQMNANSMSAAQLSALGAKTVASFLPNQMGLIRIDGTDLLIAGITFRSADQQMLTTKASDLNVVIPQPAPHQGVVFYPGAAGLVSYTRFQGAGRAINSQPPFEMANITSQYGNMNFHHVESDGRRAFELDPARPRRCTVNMGNNESGQHWEDSWLHHSNVSRVAINDENRATSGPYSYKNVKVERITDNHNVDPALNGGASLGGWTNASCMGWESSSSPITLIDPFLSQDNSQFSGQVPCHLQVTTVGSRNPPGGRMYVYGGTFRNLGFPTIDGFLTIRVHKITSWYLDGMNNTFFFYNDVAGTQRKLPHEYTGAWPPSAAYIASNGLNPATHYIVRGI